jgi:hypothetical protein
MCRPGVEPQDVHDLAVFFRPGMGPPSFGLASIAGLSLQADIA